MSNPDERKVADLTIGDLRQLVNTWFDDKMKDVEDELMRQARSDISPEQIERRWNERKGRNERM